MKKIIHVLLIVTLTLSLVACQDKEENKEEENKQDTQQITYEFTGMRDI